MSMRSRSVGAKRARTTKRTYKKTSRSASTFGLRSVAVAARNLGIGASTNTVLRTSFFTNITTTVGTGVFNGFLKPGSAFDPTGDLAAIQPQMFDQFAAMYNRYKVNKAVIRMKITGNTAGANTTAVWVAAAYPAVDSTALTTYQAAASQQLAKTTSGGFQLIGSAGVGTEGKMLSFNLNHDQILGSRSDTYDSGALVTGDPSTFQYMVLPIFIQSNAAGTNTLVLEIDMFQYVTFSGKKNTVDA